MLIARGKPLKTTPFHPSYANDSVFEGIPLLEGGPLSAPQCIQLWQALLA